jgi:melanoma-associated antigen p97
LRTKKACGTAIGDMAGWHIPVNYLISIKELYTKTGLGFKSCHIPKIAGEYFGRSCIPGAEDYDYNTLKTNPRALCLQCYSKGSDYCSRSQREYYYGDTGAFRCLNEGFGDVAFMRHTGVQLNTDGRNTDQWARPHRQTDFELLCKDGTRKSIEQFERCNLMSLPTKVIMIGSHRNYMQKNYLWNMLNFAQQLFGSDTNPDFTLFESMKEHPDLVFSDACLQLIPVLTDLNTYLGDDIIEIIKKTDPRMCNSTSKIAFNYLYSIIFIILSLVVVF